jgi:phage tail-like protein
MLIATTVLVSLSILATLTIASVWAPNPRPDPSGGFSFRVEIDGIAIASFSEVEGVNVSVDIFEYREGTDQLKPQLVPGVAHFGPVILRKGITSPNKELWEWMEMTLDGSVSRRHMSIILMNPSRTDIMRVNLADAWPSGWSLGRLDGLNKEPVLEELVIQYEDISVEIYGTD